MGLGNNHLTTTTSAEFIPAVWINEVRAAREANLVMAKRVKLINHKNKPGDTLNIPDVSALTAQDKVAETEVSLQSPTETKFSVSINKWKHVAFLIEDMVKVQSATNLRKEYTDKAGFAVAKAVDSDLLALYSSLTQSTGSSSIDIDEETVLEAKKQLDEADAPRSDRTLLVAPSQEKSLLRIPRFTEADKIADSGKALKEGMLGRIHGFDVFVSTNIPVVGTTTKNIAFHKDAFVLATQSYPRVQAAYVLEYLGTLVVVDEIYGVSVFRNDHAVVINS
ncbi:MAG: phage capsid protein [Vampirovibrionia bacterium]